ncbi:hypothetical protein Cgig2_006636 [Carnegiea gigantea]|uniref:Morc S5 domain-containing protein n=1 Tax=Carnegiea gigantea TaxID=171969 RepID=A0A9Q1JP34_9CARY|nr:hypothetical protein Cgig2_006636 [Carnegiea gigantea]
MALMKKTLLQGPRPRVRRTPYHACLQGHRPHSPGNAEQRDNEYPENKNDDTMSLEYPTKYPTKYSVSWSRSRLQSSYEGSHHFAMDQNLVAWDRDHDHDEGDVVVDDVSPSKFNQNRRFQNYVKRSRECKPYFGKRRYQTQEDHQRRHPRAWKNHRGTRYHHSSNPWIRNDHESRTPNSFEGSQSSPFVHGRTSPSHRPVKSPLSSLHVGEPLTEQVAQSTQEHVRLSVAKPKLESSIPPATPPLENADARKKLAIQLRQGHGQVEHETLENAMQQVSDHTSTDSLKKVEVRLHDDHGDQTKGKEEKHDTLGGSSNHASASTCYFKLMKDNKTICRTECRNPPIQPPYVYSVRSFVLINEAFHLVVACGIVMRSANGVLGQIYSGYVLVFLIKLQLRGNNPLVDGANNQLVARGSGKAGGVVLMQLYTWNINIVKKSSLSGLTDLPQFPLFPAFENPHQGSEWTKFLTYLHLNNKVATVEFEGLKIGIIPPEGARPIKTVHGLDFSHAVVVYKLQEVHDTTAGQNHVLPVLNASAETAINSEQERRSGYEKKTQGFSQTCVIAPDACVKGQMAVSLRDATHSTRLLDIPAIDSDAHVKGSNSAEKGTCSSISKFHTNFAAGGNNSPESNFVRADPSYLKTLGQAHSGWIFGAIAELVDNSRDANASRLDVRIETIYDKRAGCEIPMLSVIDDGDGMNHQQILRMISFGHRQPDQDDRDRIGRFGVGFKTGAMRLGRDALVLTQTTESRSIAFLSQSLNEGKDNVEIPIVSYHRQSQCMEFDGTVQSEALAVRNLRAIKEFSPFNEYLIGEKSALFKDDTGTQIYIWNMDKWGSDYSLEWQAGISGSSSFHHGDILIRSRRVRSRPGQTSRKVPLDYSLRSYLEVIFLEPRMKIYVQGSPVKSRPLAKSLNNTAVENGEIMGKPMQLTLGRCQLEWDQANCGVFLYWHGRLIEAYKRVGGMIHSADIGRGVIGVIDVTELMAFAASCIQNDGNGGAWVHSNKQGFQDCEPNACLEEWLGRKADEYWDTHFDALQLRKGNATYQPDHEWVQCEKCRKWRVLDVGFDSSTLSGECHASSLKDLLVIVIFCVTLMGAVKAPNLDPPSKMRAFVARLSLPTMVVFSCRILTELQILIEERNKEGREAKQDKTVSLVTFVINVAEFTFIYDNLWLKKKTSLAPFWKMINVYSVTTLKRTRFCYMEPFNGGCEMPEQKVGRGVITIGTKRLGHSIGAAGGKSAQIDNNAAQGIL